MKDKYVKQCIKYYENANKFLELEEYEKSSEFLWGSVSQILKAVAGTKGIKLKTHQDLWNYARELSKELNDKSIWDTFYKARTLHTNFYEANLQKEDIILVMEDIKELIIKLFKIIGYEPK